MKKINIRRLYYKISHDFFTLNNGVIAIGVIIAAGFVWGSLGVMQRNYTLQKELDDKKRSLIVAQLDTENAKLEQRYYKTNEYQELAVRERLGLVTPGESVLILPKNSQAVIDADEAASATTTGKVAMISKFGQWMNFLFGGNSKSISS